MRNINKVYDGSRAARPANVISYNGEYYINGTQSGAKSVSDLKSREVEICEESGYLATPDCKHKKTKTYDAFSEDEIPEYYCNIHNSNPEKYPISPEETLVEQKKDSSTSTPSSPTTPSSP